MKYYSHNEADGSREDLKRYDQFFNSEKIPGRGGGEQKQKKAIGKRCRKADILTTEKLERFFVTVHQENGTREYLIKSKILSIPEK
jgi:hypothetical protein